MRNQGKKFQKKNLNHLNGLKRIKLHENDRLKEKVTIRVCKCKLYYIHTFINKESFISMIEHM